MSSILITLIHEAPRKQTLLGEQDSDFHQIMTVTDCDSSHSER